MVSQEFSPLSCVCRLQLQVGSNCWFPCLLKVTVWKFSLLPFLIPRSTLPRRLWSVPPFVVGQMFITYIQFLDRLLTVIKYLIPYVPEIFIFLLPGVVQEYFSNGVHRIYRHNTLYKFRFFSWHYFTCLSPCLFLTFYPLSPTMSFHF